MNFKELLPLIGVLIGWGLHEFSSWATSRRTDRRIYGDCLAALLTIHRQLKVAVQTAEVFNASDSSDGREFPSSLLPIELWSQHISLLRSVGHRLTGPAPFMAHHILSLLSLLESVPSEPDGSKTTKSTNIEDRPRLDLTEVALLQTSAAALLVARKHGIVSLVRTWRLVRKQIYIPEEALEWSGELEEWSKRQKLRKSFHRRV